MINNVMCDSIYGEYIQLTQKYNKKYGKNCVVLLQVGAFFEVYGFKCTETNDVQESEICEFSRICNLNISEKGKDFFDMIFVIDVHNLDHLNEIIDSLKQVSNVSSVNRLFINL